MRFLLVSTFVPFINGGARFIVEWLEEQLLEHGHEVERFYLPYIDDPNRLLEQAAAFRLMDLEQSADRLIAVRPPAHVLTHPHKRLWFIHHIRAFYDLWGGPYAPAPTLGNAAIRDALRRLDTATLSEAECIYTNSKVVSARLKAFNGLESDVLYPPIQRPERFRCDGYGNEVVVVCRLEPHKRQALLVQAMAHVQTPVKLRLCGTPESPRYAHEMEMMINGLGVADRVSLEARWITEAEKADLLAGALACAYVPLDEDSYGYPSLEAAHSRKAVLTTSDAGGVLELVEDGVNGLVTEPEPRAIAAALDRLWSDKAEAERMGRANAERLVELRINWGRVVTAFAG
jgi:glycosyltransferase involved in cell wall biosynthesis